MKKNIFEELLQRRTEIHHTLLPCLSCLSVTIAYSIERTYAISRDVTEPI